MELGLILLSAVGFGLIFNKFFLSEPCGEDFFMIKVSAIFREIKFQNPEEAYKKLEANNTYLLELAEGGEKAVRYSFIGFGPAAKLKIKNRSLKLKVFNSRLRDMEIKGENPLEVIQNLLSQFEFAPNKELDNLPFTGGFAGYLAYDLVRRLYNLSQRKRDDLKEPDCEFVLAKNNLVFDHKKKKLFLVLFQFLLPKEKVKHNTGPKDFERILRKLSSSLPVKRKRTKQSKKRHFSFNVSKKRFKKMVKKAKDYILAGDIIQVVLSQRLKANYYGCPFQVYQNLKRLNPSPYMYYLNFGKRKVVGASPEMLAKIENGHIETYPIAGTRPRGRNKEEDRRLEKEMLDDKKEKAEHLMLVDLARNDLGKVANFGSVNIEKLMTVGKYSHVQHLVSKVSGELKSDESEFSALRSIFPAGTVSGAPKVRAMEIVDELEPTRRGIYAGAVGYFSFNRNINTAITIRTIVFEGRTAYVQAGAGIVADSEPEKEYQETINKAKAMMRVLEI